MANKKTWKLLIVAAVLFTVLSDGLAAQVGREYQVTNVEYLGDFEDGNPRDRAINGTVAREQRQNPGFTFERRDTEYMSSLEIHLITRAYEQTNGNANVDSTYAVSLSSEARRYIIFIQYLPFAGNPYYYWVYCGNKR